MTSVLGISDLVFGDLLSEQNMKPLWERFKGYCFAASVTTALFMFYLTLTASINCSSTAQNETLTFVLKRTHTAVMNNYCVDHIPWYAAYAGYISLLLIVFILIVSMYWLHHSEVMNSFNTFKEVEDIVKDLFAMNDDLKSLSVEPLDDRPSGKSERLRVACILLWTYKCKININAYYFKRNWRLVAAILISMAVSFCILYFLCCSSDRKRFHCSLTENDHLEIYGTGLPVKYFCFYNIGSGLVPSVVVFIATLIGQLFFVVMGIWKFRAMQLKEHLSEEMRKPLQFVQFMTIFWKSSRPNRSGAFSEFTNHIFSKEALDLMLERSQKAVKNNDMQFIGMICKLMKEGNSCIILTLVAMVHQIMKKGQGLPIQPCMLECLKNVEGSVENDNTKKLVQIAVDHKHWQLLVAVLNSLNSDDIVRNQKFIGSLELNLDELEKWPVQNPRSILYYALSNAEFFKAAEYILGGMNDGRLKYVHTKSKTMPAKDFVEDVFVKLHPHLGDTKKKRMLDMISKSEENGRVASRSQEDIKCVLEEHEKAVENISKSDFEYFHHVQKMAEELSCYKFTECDDDVKKFARIANDHKQWSIFVALLNSYIVRDHDTTGLRRIDCGIYEFDATDRRSCLTGLLRTALPDRSSFHPQHFISTAAEHILACTLPQELDNPQSHPGFWAVEEFSIPDIIIMLKTRIEESMKEGKHLEPQATCTPALEGPQHSQNEEDPQSSKPPINENLEGAENERDENTPLLTDGNPIYSTTINM